MSDCSENRNPLKRNGTSQGQRVLAKLSPSSVEVLDKSTEDWMVWASKFSKHIGYTSINNDMVGSMEPFFTNNVSAQLALVASYPPETLSKYIREVLLYIETNENGLKKAYTQLFDIILSYLAIVDQLFQVTKADDEYNKILLYHIQAKLLPLESRTFAYYKASLEGTVAQRLIVQSQVINTNIFSRSILSHKDVINNGFSNLSEQRYISGVDFDSYFGAIASDTSIFGGLTGFKKRIKYVTQHNFFTSILDEISASVNFIVKLSQKYIEKYVSNWPHHKPNYALYLTWLQILDDTKWHLNELTGRHLDFYYKDVLKLRPLEQNPDKAFLSIELNKVTSSYALKNNTLFMGPKDDNGEVIIYKSIRETVLNKAKIKHLSSLYFGDEDDNIGTTINNRRLFSAPIINSADGLGEVLSEDAIAWHPFHIKTFENGELSAVNMPKAEVGFAIASHYLRLKEGEREIQLTLQLSKSLTLNSSDYQAFITTEKEWLELDTQATIPPNGALNKMQFTFTVPADKDPIVAYNKDVHLGTLTATEPVLRIVLKHQNNQPFLYDSLSSTTLYRVELKVKVGETTGSYNEGGIKNLELHNDTSPLNPSKPFHPWGAEPTVGNSFIIGSDEVFYKQGAKVQLNFKWKDIPRNNDGDMSLIPLDYDASTSSLYTPFYSSDRTQYVPSVEILKLSKNKWETITGKESEAVLNNDIVDKVIGTIPVYKVVDKLGLVLDLTNDLHKEIFLDKSKTWNSYSSNSTNGYIKVKLNHDFGHRDYYLALQSFFKENEKGASAPAYPYKPTLESFSVSYEASCNLRMFTNNVNVFSKRPLEFFHTGPFGDSEQHKVLQKKNPKLLSKFISKTNGTYKSQGSFFIGIENIEPGDTQSILFQIQEGSEDPLLEKPENHLVWQYLIANNKWVNFSDDGVGDNTSGLIESGLINFIIPEDASLVHTAFENNLIWIRCLVTKSPNAVAKIIGVYPNSIIVERVIPDGTEYKSMMSVAGEIKKLLIPDAKLKKITQNFTSFEGNSEESDEAFYLRASERLRHKDRAITIWDIEKLILQAFPEIYKVKCLNHTKIEGSLNEANLIYNEVAPGHIAVITIPNLSNRNDIDPLKPYTKKSTLKAIKEFLRKRTSCHITLHTSQPDFEEVKVKCNITLRKEFSDINYYKSVIQNDLMNYLSPWAFTSDTDLNFGGRIHKSVLIDFIEELGYVDFLTDFELIHIKSNGDTTKVEEAVASTARSILVSVPASKHNLTVLLKAPETVLEIDCVDE
ncbi:hypothetical protein [uncultured Lacinutrix sp.]|uniref:hypothetical protein n=1 Tax=uncultured Lacinutrix sp. TaxID=574032 RepID=UPI002604702E|nr:hypothetical protein [uncultured Lacinutrix sp.]